MAIEYLDFELQIGRGDGRTYPLAVINSPAGNLRAQMTFTLGELELENRLLALKNALLRSGGQRRKTPTSDEKTVQTFGTELFSTLFQDDVRSLFFESRRIAAARGKYLRVKLRILDPQMAALPWEYLFDARLDEYLSLSHNTPLIRYLEVPQPPRPLLIKPPLRVLGMIASPIDLEPLKVEIEKQRLEEALAALITRGLVQLEWLQGQTWRDLHRAMRPNQGPWHVFHFVGHGGFDPSRDEGLLVFADRTSKSDPRTATDIARLLSSQPTLRLALLNACEGAYASQTDIFASTAATLVQRGVPAVIAMQYEITDRAAIEFSHSFYDALTSGLPIDAAVTDARRGVSLAVNNTLEWGIPVLFMRSPDGVIFEFSAEEPRQERDEPIIGRDNRLEPVDGQLVEEQPVEGQLVKENTGDKIGDQDASPSFVEKDVEENLETDVRREKEKSIDRALPTIDKIPKLGRLSGPQIRALDKAMRDAYTTPTLTRLVRFQLGERLDEIAGVGSTFADQVYQLIEWAEHRGRLGELIIKAQADNPQHDLLRQVAVDILGAAANPKNVAPQPPQTPIHFDWCHVPAGEFLMGSDDGYNDEKPQHSFYLPDFYIAKTPVTNAQYKHFVDAQGHQLPKHWENGSIPDGKENHPVVYISWHDAQAFCAWANVQLSSEAQWEKAARGSDGRIYPWGNQPPTQQRCNFDLNVGDTTPVGSYPDCASPYGCLDMAGNVWEWTKSQLAAYPYDAHDGREDRESSAARVVRGGSFLNDQNRARSAYRNNLIANAYYGVGVRVVCVPI